MEECMFVGLHRYLEQKNDDYEPMYPPGFEPPADPTCNSENKDASPYEFEVIQEASPSNFGVPIQGAENVEEEALNEDDLVETQVSWGLGKELGLKVGNEKAMIHALSKVREMQDFVLPRKRGRPRKKKGTDKA